MGQGEPGTLGELSPKPHPWLYAEAARVGLGIPFEDRGTVVGIEDSGAGVCAIRLAGFAPIGVAGGNIEAGDAGRPSVTLYCDDLYSVLTYLPAAKPTHHQERQGHKEKKKIPGSLGVLVSWWLFFRR